MTKPTENHDETAYLLGNKANIDHLRRSIRQFEGRKFSHDPKRETLLRNAYARAKRAAESALARNAHRLRLTREQWQSAVDEGR